MENPCNNCIVSACCSECCNEKAEWILNTEEYRNFGESVTKHIEEMKHKDAISHISMCEDLARYIKS